MFVVIRVSIASLLARCRSFRCFVNVEIYGGFLKIFIWIFFCTLLMHYKKLFENLVKAEFERLITGFVVETNRTLESLKAFHATQSISIAGL